MKNISKQSLLRIPPVVLFFISGIALTVKVVMDAISFTFTDSAIIISPIIAFIFVITLYAGIIINEFQWHNNEEIKNSNDFVLQEVITHGKLLSMAALLNVVGLIINDNAKNIDFFSSITYNLFAAYSILICSFLLAFNVRIMYNRLHKHSIILTRWIFVGLLLFLASLLYFNNNNLSYGLGFILLGICLYNTRRLDWIAEIPKKDKVQLLWYSAGSILATALWSFHDLSSSTPSERALNLFLSGITPLVFLSGLWYFFILIRILFGVLYSLPTASLIDRKSSEIFSLASLTRIASQNTDTQTILNTFTKLAKSTIHADAVFCSAFVDDTHYTSIVSNTINHEIIHTIITSTIFVSLLNEIHTVKVIDNVSDYFSDIDNYVYDHFCSLIIVPLGSQQENRNYLVAFHKETYHFSPEDIRIVEALKENLLITLENSRLIKKSIHHERVEKEIQIARQLQNKLLPLQLPEIPGYTLSMYSKPAYEVGGDFVDALVFPNGNICMIIADVSGKGIPAAFSMSTLKGALLSIQLKNQQAKELIITLNKALSSQLEKHMFITLSCLIIQPETGNVEFCRAGHLPLITKIRGNISIHKPKGLGIGITNATLFEQSLETEYFQLHKGDLCFLFTDGLTDSLSLENNEEGMSILANHLKENLHNSIDCISSITTYIEQLNHQEQHDDITAIAISRD